MHAGLVAVPSCVTVASIKQLVKWQRPHRIFVIVPLLQPCQVHLASIDPVVHCVHESSIVPGLTAEAVARNLTALYPELRAQQFEMGRSPAGWYLQQVR
jgi:hypothetical protein